MTVFPFAINKLKPTLKGQVEEEEPGGELVKGQWGQGSKTRTARSGEEVLKGGRGRSLGPGRREASPMGVRSVHWLQLPQQVVV